MAVAKSQAAQPRTAAPAGQTMPTATVMKAASMSQGTAQRTARLERGAMRETRPKLPAMTGRVMICAARATARPARRASGSRERRSSRRGASQTRPMVAATESWKPTSQSCMGCQATMRPAERATAVGPLLRRPRAMPARPRVTMMAALTTAAPAPTRRVKQRTPRTAAARDARGPRRRLVRPVRSPAMTLRLKPETTTMWVRPADCRAAVRGAGRAWRVPRRTPAARPAWGSATAAASTASARERRP